MRRILSRYMATVGLIANILLLAFILYWFTNKVAGTESFREVRRAALGSLDGVPVVHIEPVASGQSNPQFANLPAGVWHKIHQQAGGPGAFRRQLHGGAAFDRARGRLMLFGSDTHGLDWDNTVRFFDMGLLEWSQSYPPDAPETYRVNKDGIPVAGVDGDHPWAMHSFDAVEFDPISDRLIVASHPAHMAPSKSWGVDRGLWQSIKRHPTWVYEVGTGEWTALDADAVSFFPYGATFDARRRVMIGVRPNQYWSMDVDDGEWTQLAKGSPSVWHNIAAYDSKRDIVVSYGGNTKPDAVWQYRRGDEMAREMPTPGERPPRVESAPLVYHPGVDRVVALVEEGGAGVTGTWLYAVDDDAWERLQSADIPFAIGMNHDMVYDPNNGLLVLVANMLKEPTAVWVLRLE